MSMSCSIIQRSMCRPLLRFFTSSKINSNCCLPVISYSCCRNFSSNVPLPKIPQQERSAVFSHKIESEDVVDVKDLVASEEAFQSPDYFQVHNLFTVRDLFDARVHFGHKIGSLHKDMKPFIYGHRFETVIFDLDKTAFHLRQALNFIAHIAYRRGIILFVTRAPHTLNMVENAAIEVGEYAHCRQWSSSVLTNSTSKFGGLTRLPDLIIVMNTLDTVMAEHRVVPEAAKMLIPTVGIVDSNCAPNLITFPIPGNDDTVTSVEFYLKVFKEAIMRGKNRRKLNDNKASS